MQVLAQALAQVTPTLAIATIYCLWHRVHLYQLRRETKLRERVAYMLWCAATETN
jgi:hypothetical protein